MGQPRTEPPAEEAVADFEKEEVSEATFLRVLDDAVEAIRRRGIAFVSIGSIPSVVLGRPRWSPGAEDIDVFVKREDAQEVLDLLEEEGFATQKTHGEWLYKAKRDGVVVDVIFRSTGDIYLDDEMLDRAVEGEFKGRKLLLASPEDLLVMKAVAHTQDTQGYWYDALGVLARSDLDWDYLLLRAQRHGARRVLSLLVYGQSNDLVIPDRVILSLVEAIYRS